MGKSLQRTIFKWLRVTSLVAPAAADVVAPVSNEEKIYRVVKHYSGFNLTDGKFRFEDLAMGWTPFLMTSLVTYGIPKLIGIIRRL